MSKHYLLEKQNGKVIKKAVKNWARENQEKFPSFGFKNGSIVETPTSEQIDAQLFREGCSREMFNGDWYCFKPFEISENDIKNYGFNAELIHISQKKISKKENRFSQLMEEIEGLEKKQENNKLTMFTIESQEIEFIKNNGTIHPWLENYPIDFKSKHLIIGTHPPMPYNGSLKYYYGNMKEFWRMLDEVYPKINLFNNGNPKLTDIQNFQSEKSLTITDIVFKTHVEKFSTDDEMGKIHDDDFNPFLKEWLENSIVETIYFTSFGGQNSAKNLFKRWIKVNYGIKIENSKLHINEIEFTNKRKIKLINLFSPSPTARRNKNRVKEFIELSKKNNSTDYDKFRIDWYKKYLPN